MASQSPSPVLVSPLAEAAFPTKAKAYFTTTLVLAQAIWLQELRLTEMTLGKLPFTITVQGVKTRKCFRNGGDLRNGLL